MPRRSGDRHARWWLIAVSARVGPEMTWCSSGATVSREFCSSGVGGGRGSIGDWARLGVMQRCANDIRGRVVNY